MLIKNIIDNCTNILKINDNGVFPKKGDSKPGCKLMKKTGYKINKK